MLSRSSFRMCSRSIRKERANHAQRIAFLAFAQEPILHAARARKLEDNNALRVTDAPQFALFVLHALGGRDSLPDVMRAMTRHVIASLHARECLHCHGACSPEDLPGRAESIGRVLD